MTHPLHVTSEIGKLKTVLLHRPGKEVENLTPDTLEELLFDDIPYLPIAQMEHDAFAKAMQEHGVETIYLEKLTAEALSTPELRKEFVERVLRESEIKSPKASEALIEYLLAMNNQDMVDTIMAGVRKNDIELDTSHLKFSEMVRDDSLFYLKPMPNLYFTRDPAATIGEGISINRMYSKARRRESLFMEYIMKHHPRFAPHHVPIWFNRYSQFHMEGGDQLVIGNDVIAVGISLRTEAAAIEEMALNIFKNSKYIRKVLAIEIPIKRAFMHLDTVFTMVDYDKFTIHPEILNDNGHINIYTLEPGNEEGYVKVSHSTDLFETLKQALGLKDVALIQCGDGDPIVAPREQWSDGSNTLAIAPGVVVTYDRNYVSNEALRRHGIDVIEIKSAELSRGRGGPRCMSMPIYREDI